MAPPSALAIATSALQRLVKEEASYHKEQQQQEASIKKLEEAEGPDEDGNRSFQLQQEKRGLDETKAVFPNLKKGIIASIAKLESLIEAEGQKGSDSNVEELTKAKEVISSAKTATREIS